MANEKTATKKKTTASAESATKQITPAKKVTVKSKTAEKPVAKTTSKPALKVTKSSTPAKKATATQFAVIEIAGTQVKIEEGKKYTVNKISGNKGEKVAVELYNVLMVADGEKVNVGKPYVDGVKVELKIDSQKLDKKIETRKFKSKSRYRRKVTTRPMVTRFEVTKIA